MVFKSRKDAGKKLAVAVAGLKLPGAVVVVGLPRGGMVVAAEVAKELGVPLSACVVKKVGAPGNPELALGAVSSSGEVEWNRFAIADAEALEKGRAAAEEAQKGYLKCEVEGRVVVLVDDGIATGASVRVAIKVLRAAGAKEIVLAVPVAPPSALKKLDVDRIVCLDAPEDFFAVGAFYEEFAQVSEEEVRKLLLENKR